MGTNKYHNNITEKDIEYIKENINQKTIKEIAKALSKCPQTIYKTIYTLDLVFENKQGKPWNESEVTFLVNNYKSLSVEEIATKLGRTKKSIQGKASLLKLKKPNNMPQWTLEEIDYLKNNVNSVGYDELSKHLNRSLSSIYNKVYELQLIDDEFKGYKKVKREQILFIINNCDHMTDNQIARKLLISEETVSSIRKKHNITKTGNEVSGPTYIEQFVIDVLEKNNIKYLYNTKVEYYKPDFIICGTRMIIEVQGDYFHCNPFIYTNGPKDEIQIKHIVRDYYKKCYFMSRGYDILYIWEKDINENPDKVEENILKVCRSWLSLTESHEQ